MRYRVVQLSDGTYGLQYRTFLFWGVSCFGPYGNQGEAIAQAKSLNEPRAPRVIKVVWP